MKPSKDNLAVLRALDANCNRAREGVRVAEDVARFILDDPRLLKRLKALRHGITATEKSLLNSDRLRRMARDVAHDKGRESWEKNEKIRTNPQDILKANLKRTQEALRSLEEFSKLVSHSAAIRFKRIRYQCYKIEERFVG